jgi:hypothetical protein
MAVQSFQGHHNMGHLWGDVLALFVVAAVLAGSRLAKPETKEPMTHPASRMLPSALLLLAGLAQFRLGRRRQSLGTGARQGRQAGA